jgi:hypothetical protein
MRWVAAAPQFKYEGDSIESEEEGLKMAKFGQTPRRKRHGHGTITYKSGGHYVGQWAHDRREGHGVYTYACGDVYDGEWREGRYHGKGRYTSTAGGDSYDGEWAADKPHGFGRYVYAGSGTVFEGRWEKGLREGAGKELLANGDVYEGRWEAGELISLSLTHEHLLAGTDESGVRISMFTATLTCLHSAKADLARVRRARDWARAARHGTARHGTARRFAARHCSALRTALHIARRPRAALTPHTTPRTAHGATQSRSATRRPDATPIVEARTRQYEDPPWPSA